MAAPSYLKKRRETWYVQLAVPLTLQESMGCKVLTRSLKTRDKSEANRRKHSVIAELHSLLAQASARKPGAGGVDSLLAFALEQRALIESGRADPTPTSADFDATADHFLETEAKRLGVDSEGHPRFPPESAAQVRRAYSAIRGRLKYTLGAQIESYLGECAGHLTAQTLGDKRRSLEAFQGWFGGDREVAEVARAQAGEYVSETIQKRKGKGGKALSATTRKKEVSDLRSFFAWVQSRGVIDSNPFDRMMGTVRKTMRGEAPSRRPWLPAELSKVLHGVPKDDPLWAITAIAAYSGMRREEVAQLKVEDIDGKVFRVMAGKRQASVRRVPIHPTIAPLVQRLAKSAGEGYLIPDLGTGGPDNKRGWLIGKRFGYAIRKLGITDPALTFHSLRHTVVTQLEGAGVAVSTIQLIVGHKREGTTLGVYAAGVPDKVKRHALTRVTYGKVLDAFVGA